MGGFVLWEGVFQDDKIIQGKKRRQEVGGGAGTENAREKS